MKTDKICVHSFILICPHIRKKAHTFTYVKLRTKTYGAYTVYFHLYATRRLQKNDIRDKSDHQKRAHSNVLNFYQILKKKEFQHNQELF